MCIYCLHWYISLIHYIARFCQTFMWQNREESKLNSLDPARSDAVYWLGFLKNLIKGAFYCAQGGVTKLGLDPFQYGVSSFLNAAVSALFADEPGSFVSICVINEHFRYRYSGVNRVGTVEIRTINLLVNLLGYSMISNYPPHMPTKDSQHERHWFLVQVFICRYCALFCMTNNLILSSVSRRMQRESLDEKPFLCFWDMQCIRLLIFTQQVKSNPSQRETFYKCFDEAV